MSKAAKHRDTLVETAMRLFRRQGYASSGLQQILRESGAPKGSLYYYFPNGKESLGEAAVELAGTLIKTMLEDLAKKHRTPESFVKGYCTQMALWMEESDFGSGCPIATTVLETTPQSHAISKAASVAIESWIDVIAGVYERAEAPRRKAREHAELIVAAVQGSLILARLRQSKKPILKIATAIAATII